MDIPYICEYKFLFGNKVANIYQLPILNLGYHVRQQIPITTNLWCLGVFMYRILNKEVRWLCLSGPLPVYYRTLYTFHKRKNFWGLRIINIIHKHQNIGTCPFFFRKKIQRQQIHHSNVEFKYSITLSWY